MIDMVQAAEHGFPDDHPILRVAAWQLDRARGALTDRAMGSPAIEILHVFSQHCPKMALTEDEQVVQTFGPQESHPALGDRVGLRRPEGGTDLRDAEFHQPPIEPTVTIMDEEARGLAVPAAAFHDLLRHPVRGRMPSRPDVEHFPAGVIDSEEYIQGPEEDRLDAEEIAGPYRRGVLLEEPAPAWRWIPIPWTTHILCNAPGRDLKTKPC